MAFFDFLLGGSPLKRHARRVANRDAQAEDREASAHWLAEDGSDEALLALCQRFNLQLEHSLKDKKEKDLVFELLAAKGPQGARAVRSFGKSAVAFAWPVRLIERLEGGDAATAFLMELLSQESVDNELKPEKKRNLLIALAERKHPGLVDAARPYLKDFDEGVRHAAIEATAGQDGDAGRDALFDVLRNPKEESTRIRGRVAEIFASRRWAVPQDDWFAAHVPAGFRLDGNRLVEAPH